MDSEAVASVIRTTGGNFRLFERLLTQIEGIAQINNLNQVSNSVSRRPGRTWLSGRHNATRIETGSSTAASCETIWN